LGFIKRRCPDSQARLSPPRISAPPRLVPAGALWRDPVASVSRTGRAPTRAAKEAASRAAKAIMHEAVIDRLFEVEFATNELYDAAEARARAAHALLEPYFPSEVSWCDCVTPVTQATGRAVQASESISRGLVCLFFVRASLGSTTMSW
jgi:hypothetical protein